MNFQRPRSEEPGFYSADDCKVDDLRALIDQSVATSDVPHAEKIIRNIPIYAGTSLGSILEEPAKRRALMAEWARTLSVGAGVLVIKGAQTDHDAIDHATGVFERIIHAEKQAGGEGADHFAAAGSNDRIWNAQQKLCLEAPDVYARVFASPAIDAICEAWLGPNYQMTSQVNLVHPGGQAQQAHRDYHLGFQTAEVSAQYPAHVHDLSPLMTLQGGIAHVDVPVESGPTKLLPFSQAYRPGYAAWRRPDFRELFEDRYVQLPLEKGDALFFSPALFHAAGENKSTDIHRMVNLLQVSSAFGRAMENLDRSGMCRALYPVLQKQMADGAFSVMQRDAVIAATAEGYSFPTNLDLDPPSAGLAPETQAALMRRHLDLGSAPETFEADLARQDARRRP